MSDTPILGIHFNEFGEELEVFRDVVLNLEYWDCICDDDYIHPISFPQCQRCGEILAERPNAREPEVQDWRKRTTF